MTDRELLELAAKAADIQLRFLFDLVPFSDGPRVGEWNPLTDDGDALRLAVKLGLFNGGPALHKAMASLIFSGGVATDPYAATRQAIVRAAAEIGKAMP
jgi:hypothetical protein